VLCGTSMLLNPASMTVPFVSDSRTKHGGELPVADVST